MQISSILLRLLLLCSSTAVIIATSSSAVGVAEEQQNNVINVLHDGRDVSEGEDGDCDDSFPTAIIEAVGYDDAEEVGIHHDHGQRQLLLNKQRPRRLVTNPWDETQSTYAPLCPDGQRVDIRHLQSCPGGQCFVEKYQGCLHITSQECRLQFASQSQEERDGNTNNNMGWNNDNNGWNTNNNWNNNMSTRDHDHDSGDEHHDEERKCPGGQCWSELYWSCFHVLSQECRNPPTGQPTRRVTNAPTMKPVFDVEIRDYPVTLTLEGVKRGYEITPEVRAMVIRFASEKIRLYLEEPLELVEVVFVHFVEEDDDDDYFRGRQLEASSNSSSSSFTAQELDDVGQQEPHQHEQSHNRRLEELKIPMRISVKGPTNVNEFALLYIMEVLQDYIQDLVGELKAHDFDTFKNADASTETYNFSEVTEETNEPTRRPTRDPTPRPTKRPVTPYPTARPTSRWIETVHPIKLIFENVPEGYRINEIDRVSIIKYVSELLDEYMDERLELVEITYPESFMKQRRDGKKNGYYYPSHQWKDQGHRELSGTQELPLLVTVNGSKDISDFALVYIMEVFEENMESIKNFLKTKVDFEVYVNVEPSAETYDLSSLGDTEVPTLSPVAAIVLTPTEEMIESVHPIRLVFDNAPPGFEFTPSLRATMIAKIKDILKEGLKPPLSLSSISYTGRRRMIRIARILQGSPTLPLLIAVEGPPNSSEIADEILEVIDDNMDELEDLLEGIDDRVEDPELTAETFDPNTPMTPAPLNFGINFEEEENWWIQPWWVWLLVGIGLLALICCLCFFFRCLCRYQEYKRNYEKELVKESAIVESPPQQQPVVVEKPIIIEKPVIVEKEIVRHRKAKKHKKKKKKHKRPQVLQIEAPPVPQIEQQPMMYEHHQIEQISDDDGPFIAIPHEAYTTRSGLTFDYDPPSENYLQLEGADSFHGRLLGPSVADEPPLQLMPPTDGEEEQSYLKICADGGSSFSPATRSRSVRGGNENQSQNFAKDPSEREGGNQSQGTYYLDQTSQAESFDPSGAAFDAAFDALANWQYGDDPEDGSRRSRSNRYYSKEPSGYEFSVAPQQHQMELQDEASYRSGASTQTPSVAPPQSVISRASSKRTSRSQRTSYHSEQQSIHTQPAVAAAMASYRQQQQQHQHPASFITQQASTNGSAISGTMFGQPQKVPKKKSRRQSGGISSDSDSEILLYSYPQPGSTTF